MKNLDNCILALALVLVGLSISGQADESAQKIKIINAPQRGGRTQQSVAQTGLGAAIEVNSYLDSNRSVRAADKNSDNYDIIVTNTCERESMFVNIKTTAPFYGLIHSLEHRQKANCRVEGNGKTEYNLEIKHALNTTNPDHCGVIRARKESINDKDILSVVIAVRRRRNVDRFEDKFFRLNCTNRCRLLDCSNPSLPIRLDPSDITDTSNKQPLDEDGDQSRLNNKKAEDDQCTIWKFPWAIAMLWCMGILLLAMLISHCFLCSTMVCNCVKSEVQEKEPSIYEDSTDCETDQNNKRYPHRIEYDNNDIYKNSNNYEPYSLEQTKSKRTNRQKKR